MDGCDQELDVLIVEMCVSYEELVELICVGCDYLLELVVSCDLYVEELSQVFCCEDVDFLCDVFV